ncbi:hypothetical protein M758_UG002700 [Ceratodon purpureus]|nr:hypothetical protein M758_UG002700 [Ceratodon purpureus]
MSIYIAATPVITLVLGFSLKHSWCGGESRAREGGTDADDGDDDVVVVHELAFSFRRFLSNAGRSGCVSKDRNELKGVSPFLVTLEAGNQWRCSSFMTETSLILTSIASGGLLLLQRRSSNSIFNNLRLSMLSLPPRTKTFLNEILKMVVMHAL